MKRFPRSSGVLLHPTALPGPHGIGTLGEESRTFLQWLEEAGQSYWQICPLVPTGYGDSPYQGFSAFAGNPNLIDINEIRHIGLLEIEDLAVLENFPDHRVDFGRLIPAKTEVLMKAWRRFTRGSGPQHLKPEWEKFRRAAASWLDDYCLFMALKAHHQGKPWNQWDEDFRLRQPKALGAAEQEFRESINYHAFLQFLFHRQWETIKEYASQRNIRIIGDLPIFVAFDSSDCWSHPELFQLDIERRPIRVAGVPPDYFSATGQLWGNPLYDWDAMEGNDFAWWLSVLEENLERYDILRIDHFRGFAAYWSVPYGEETAVNGEWIPAPGPALFRRVRDVMGEIPIIAEDLGVITDDVVELITEFGFPGMKVLQFAFDSSEENDYLPHNYGKHCLVYSGTHDNNTAAGWFDTAPEENRQAAVDYLNLPPDASGPTAAKAMVRAAMASVSDLALTPLQDILGLGGDARFNTPGVLGDNWSWRASLDAFSQETAQELRKLTRIYGRLSQKSSRS